MGILDALLGKDNPFSQFADNNSNTLGAIGSGLAAGPTFSQGLSNAAQAIPQAKALDRQSAEAIQTQNATVQYLKAKYPDLADAVQQGLPVQTAWAQALQRDAESKKLTSVSPGASLVDQSGHAVFTAPATARAPLDMSQTVQGRQQLAQQYGLTGQDAQTYVLTGKLPGANNSMKYGNTPIYARDSEGHYLAVQPGSDGSTNVMKLPDGFNVDPGALNSDRAAGSAYGSAQGGAQFNLPAAKQNVEAELGNIDALGSDQKGIDETFGKVGGIWPQQWAPTIPGTTKADYAAKLDQVTGQNFLQAYVSLKGAGAITEVEGAKAQDAMARLSRAQSEGAYTKALADLKDVLKTGYDRMAKQAAAGPYQSSGYQPPALNGGGNTTSSGVQWSISQ